MAKKIYTNKDFKKMTTSQVAVALSAIEEPITPTIDVYIDSPDEPKHPWTTAETLSVQMGTPRRFDKRRKHPTDENLEKFVKGAEDRGVVYKRIGWRQGYDNFSGPGITITPSEDGIKEKILLVKQGVIASRKDAEVVTTPYGTYLAVEKSKILGTKGLSQYVKPELDRRSKRAGSVSNLIIADRVRGAENEVRSIRRDFSFVKREAKRVPVTPQNRRNIVSLASKLRKLADEIASDPILNRASGRGR